MVPLDIALLLPEVFTAYKTRFHTKRALLKLLLLRGLFRATCAEKELIITRMSKH